MPHQCTNCDRRFPDGSKEMLSGCPDCGGNKFQFSPATRDDRTESNPAQSSSATPAESGAGSVADSTASNSAATSSSPSDASTREWPETARRPAERDAEFQRDGSPSQPSPEIDERDDAMEDDFEWVKGDEDTAQASARSDVVSPDELPGHTSTDHDPVEGQSKSTRTDAEPTSTADHPATEPTRTGDHPRTESVPTGDRPGHGRVVSEPEDDQPSLEQLREELNDQFESIKILNPGQYELNLMELYDREEHIVSLQEDGRYVINVPETWHSDE